MKTLHTLRTAVLTAALVAVSSTAAFAQLQIPGATDVDIRVKNAVAFSMGCYSNINNCANGPSFRVPIGYRLVITQISARNGTPANFVLVGTLNGEKVIHSFPIAKLGGQLDPAGGSHNCFVVLDSISPSESDLSNNAQGIVQLSGYLVKM